MPFCEYSIYASSKWLYFQCFSEWNLLHVKRVLPEWRRCQRQLRGWVSGFMVTGCSPCMLLLRFVKFPFRHSTWKFIVVPTYKHRKPFSLYNQQSRHKLNALNGKNWARTVPPGHSNHARSWCNESMIFCPLALRRNCYNNLEIFATL